MMVLRWLWFVLGSIGFVLVTVKIWRGEGWVLGGIMAMMSFVSICNWLEDTMLKQWHMKKIVTYEEDYE